MTVFLSDFVRQLDAIPRRNQSYRAVCPFCLRGSGQRKPFHLDQRGYRCTACHANGSLATLAIYVDPHANVCADAPRLAVRASGERNMNNAILSSCSENTPESDTIERAV